jgi:hypothetical protein
VFDGATVVDPELRHMWPAGRVVVEQEGGTGILTRQSSDSTDG